MNIMHKYVRYKRHKKRMQEIGAQALLSMESALTKIRTVNS